MDEYEAKRIAELEKIYGRESVDRLAFYDQIDYYKLVFGIRVHKVKDRLKTLKAIRSLVSGAMAEMSAALKPENGAMVYSESLESADGCLHQWKAVRRIMKLKSKIQETGCICSVDVWLPDGSFSRENIDDTELDYIATRVSTWM